jgi:hypothetical protein
LTNIIICINIILRILMWSSFDNKIETKQVIEAMKCILLVGHQECRKPLVQPAITFLFVKSRLTSDGLCGFYVYKLNKRKK